MTAPTRCLRDAPLTNRASLDGLVVAKEWERAAIVAAFTRPGIRGPGAETLNSESLSVTDFAALGVIGCVGLRSAVAS